MSRTYRLRHLPQPEGGALSRRFVDASVREPARRAEDAFLASNKLDPDVLWSIRIASPYWALGWTRVVPMYWHPVIGYSLPHVPSSEKKYGRKQAYRTHRRHSKRLLRLCDKIRYLDEGVCGCYDCDDPFCDLPGVPELRWTSGPEIDPDSDAADFEARSIKSGLKRSAWLLTW